MLSKLNMTNGAPNGNSDGNSPTDAENAERNMATLESNTTRDLKIDTSTKTNDPLLKDAIDSANNAFADDPLSAVAMGSPHFKTMADATSYFSSGRLGSIDGIAKNDDGLRWQSFKRVGPRYPPSLEKLIMDYHHKQSRSWQLVHDMGAGSGVYSPILARYFRHVHVSEPQPTGLATSRQLLSTWSASNKKSRGRFTFSNTTPEQGHEAVADQTVDLAIMMQGAHFTDAELMVRSAAQTLSKDGTLALVTYTPTCRVTGNPRANEAAQRLFAAWGVQPWTVACGDARGQKQFSLGLDFVPLPEDLFDPSKTRRITINTQNKGSAAFQVPIAAKSDASDSRLRSDEKCQDYSSEIADDVAKGWRQDVGPEFFRSLTAALVGSQAANGFEAHFKDIQKIAHETSPDGINITVEWTVAIVLATRR